MTKNQKLFIFSKNEYKNIMDEGIIDIMNPIKIEENEDKYSIELSEENLSTFTNLIKVSDDKITKSVKSEDIYGIIFNFDYFGDYVEEFFKLEYEMNNRYIELNYEKDEKR